MELSVALIILIVHIQICTGNIISGRLQKENNMTKCGTVSPFPAAQKRLACSLECLKNNLCTAILFDEKEIAYLRCKLILSDSASTIDLSVLPQYEYFAIRADKQVTCDNMGIETPEGWDSECPKLYFPLDSDQSAAYGGSSAHADFSTSGKLGQSMHLENDGSPPYAYHNLGSSYVSPQYCFPDPSSCTRGASFAFWMKIPQEPTSPASGYLTIKPTKGPGFAVYWFKASSYNSHMTT